MSDYVWSQETGKWLLNPVSSNSDPLAYSIVDTGQVLCFNDSGVMDAPSPGEKYYGQD